ncbi:hypothetical protein IFM89_025180 [Coptis chinensis]|uniref:GOLD domain-containing protein n=1 Tax=Coptis chinensis TaxID=261450 RepID=A0A835HJX9_9MAGN|nr:hypothetical protein IFM89_025180 [Coptis chinensis]
MAEETVAVAAPAPPAEVVEVVKKETKEVETPVAEEAVGAVEEEGAAIPQSVSFKEEKDGTKTVVAIEETVVAVAKEEEEAKTETVVETKEEETTTPIVEEEEQVPPEEVFTWGIPLIGDEKSDTILLKFLRARDFKVKDAFTMVKNTVLWRKEFGIEGLLDEDLGTDLEKVVFMNGFDKEGHPVCYNVYGEFQNKELYQKTFSDEEKSKKFLRWRIQFLEKSIQKLDFSPGGICTIVQVNDLKNSPGPLKTELRHATNQALSILQDNYPEFVAKQTCLLVWELRVLGWDVSYGAEFVPSAEDGYTVIVQKTRKIAATDEPVITNSFKIGEPGKVVLTIDNTTSKKKKLLYRFKTSSD